MFLGMKGKIIVVLLSLFVVHCIQAEDVANLLAEAQTMINQNETDKALDVYLKVLDQDANNFMALVYVCGFHYQKGLAELHKLDAKYSALHAPNRMQTARFENALKALYETRFKLSEVYLIKAYLIRKNEHLDQMAGVIADVKKRIGLLQDSGKKK
jgi:methionine synthase II (cobalamin-independent)